MPHRKRPGYVSPSRRIEEPAREGYFPPGTLRTVLLVGGTGGAGLIVLAVLLSLR